MLLGFYADSDQNFLVELKPETAKECANIFRKMQNFCGKDVFSLEVEEFLMRAFPLDNVWELEFPRELPEGSDFIEIEPSWLIQAKEGSDLMSGNAVLNEMGLFWHIRSRTDFGFADIPTPVLTLNQLDAIAILGEPQHFGGRA